jgi:protoporphyrinogen IX oxidase
MDQIDFFKALKFFHIVFITTWMAGLFYLPRLFVYHAKEKRKTKQYETFAVMEKKLLMYIMNPSMILTWIFGFLLITHLQLYSALWINLKLVCVVLMSIFHMYCARIRKNFEIGSEIKDEKFYRWINEIPTVLFLIIIFLVVFKPFV